jgi:hypothetical protein
VSNFYTFDDMPGFVSKAAGYVAYRYRNYGVEADDVQQEIYVWLYGKGRSKVERWLGNEPQQTTRIYLSMLDVGRKYGEKEKAAKAGYRPEDVWWYTPASVESLMPLVMDSTYTQANGHVGELITMVMDIRSAVQEAGLSEFFEQFGAEEEHPDYRVNVMLVLDRLGGERPIVGRRRAMSNAQAQAVTSEAYE